MQISVLLFAGLAERVGARRVEVAFEPGDVVATIRDRLVAAHPDIECFVPNLVYAVDEEYADETTVMPEGATLALIPPVSGGSTC